MDSPAPPLLQSSAKMFVFSVTSQQALIFFFAFFPEILLSLVCFPLQSSGISFRFFLSLNYCFFSGSENGRGELFSPKVSWLRFLFPTPLCRVAGLHMKPSTSPILPFFTFGFLGLMFFFPFFALIDSYPFFVLRTGFALFPVSVR